MGRSCKRSYTGDNRALLRMSLISQCAVVGTTSHARMMSRNRVTVKNPLSDGSAHWKHHAAAALPDATAKNRVYDTRLNHGYVADKANNGVTSKALVGAVST